MSRNQVVVGVALGSLVVGVQKEDAAVFGLSHDGSEIAHPHGLHRQLHEVDGVGGEPLLCQELPDRLAFGVEADDPQDGYVSGDSPQ